MTILWFWAAIVAAIFSLSAYNQASEQGWKVGAAALLLAAAAAAYLVFSWPSDLSNSAGDLARHPDELKLKALGFVFVAALVCVLGALVGAVFRRRTSPERIGAFAFAGAFVGFQSLVFHMAAAS